MILIAEGNEPAFEELIIRHQGAVIGTIAKMMGNRSDSEDIAQQAFIRVWTNAKRYKPQAKFTTWLYTIVKNLVFTASKKRKKRSSSFSIDTEGENRHEMISDEVTQNPQKAAEFSELTQIVDQAILKLPEKQRMAVILKKYEDWSYQEIAETLGVSISSLKSLLFRARTTLKEELSFYLNDPS